MTESKKNQNMEFNNLEDQLKRLLIEAKDHKLLIIDFSSGVKLPKNILEKFELFEQGSEFIQKNFEGINQKTLEFIFNYLHSKKYPLLTFETLNRYFEYEKYRSENTPISTGKNIPNTEINGSNGRSRPTPSNLGTSGSEVIESKDLSDIPINQIPDLLKKRKDDFGIWISRVALRHFQSLKTKLDPNGQLFGKLESHFAPEYSSNGWATPIDNERREELGLAFGLQFTRSGFIRIHVSSKKSERDIEKFIRDFFDVFQLEAKLSDEEIIEFLELLILERKEKACFYIHDAREIGPKNIVDETFKGAHIKVNQINWFGRPCWDARIDYSDRMKPHVEGEGPVQQVGNFMKLIDGSPEFISNLSEVRELSYRTRDKVHDNYQGIGMLSQMVQKVDDEVIPRPELLAEFSEVGAKLFGLDIKTDLQHYENQEIASEILNALKTNSNILENNTDILKDNTKQLGNLVLFINKGNEGLKEKLIDVLGEFEVDVISGLNSIDLRVSKSKHEINKNIDDTRVEITTKLDEISTRFDNLEMFIHDEFKAVKFQVKNALFLILRKIDLVPEITAKELKNLLGISQRRVYSCLKLLQEKELITSSVKRKRSRGRPPRVFKLNMKKLYKKLKKS